MLQPPFDLALSTLGVAPARAPRRIFEWASGSGFRAVMLDPARPGIRPRDLDRSSRRGLASLLRRLELRLAGAELWIPPEHYAEPATSERAVTVVLASIDLLAELSALVQTDRVLTLTLPAPGSDKTGTDETGADETGVDETGADEAVATIAQAAHRAEIRIANAAWPRRETSQSAPIGFAIDPRAFGGTGDDPLTAVTTSPEPPAAARWPYSTRRPEEVLEPLGYASALSVAGFRGDVALDLRDAINPETDAVSALARWRQADAFPS